jgi:hypothetical protein
MKALRVRNADSASALVVRVWHRSNAFMSDGDLPWLDQDGAPTAERSRDHLLSPGATLELAIHDELALTVLPDAAGETTGIAASVRRYFRAGAAGDGVGAGLAAPFSLAGVGDMPLRIRLFASATFQFSALRECSLAPGETLELAAGDAGVSARVA